MHLSTGRSPIDPVPDAGTVHCGMEHAGNVTPLMNPKRRSVSLEIRRTLTITAEILDSALFSALPFGGAHFLHPTIRKCSP